MATRNSLRLFLSVFLLIYLPGCSLPFSLATTQPTSQIDLSQEDAYMQFVQRVKTTDWSKAAPTDWEKIDQTIDQLKNYKDTPVITRYLNYLRYIQENKIDKALGVASNLPVDYFGDLQEEVKKIRLEAHSLAQAQDFKHYEELIRTGDYETLRRETVEKVSLGDDYNALYNYFSALAYQKKGVRSAMIISLSHISMPYTGLMSEEINKMITQNASEIQLTRNLLSGKTKVGLPKPYIGMTTSEVLASAWGQPDRVNATTTGDGKQEQWEYPADKIVFIENGFVTSIQY